MDERPLEHLARIAHAQLEDVALAIAGEFTGVDTAAVDARLEQLSAGLEGIDRLDPAERAGALLDELAGRWRFEAGGRGDPESLFLHRVIERRRGHPLALAIVYAAVARRVGVALHPIGCGRFVILADASSRPTVALDPAGGRRRPPRSLAWVCPHVVGVMLLRALSVSYLERGQLERSIRAAKLGLVLPLGPPMRDRVRARAIELEARLN